LRKRRGPDKKKKTEQADTMGKNSPSGGPTVWVAMRSALPNATELPWSESERGGRRGCDVSD